MRNKKGQAPSGPPEILALGESVIFSSAKQHSNARSETKRKIRLSPAMCVGCRHKYVCISTSRRPTNQALNLITTSDPSPTVT